ncbi:tetratricopeptide repeat protein [Halioglobus maricola]|uniref:Ancillary SecYEG translocon subunit n=1 Tax=Halioglobus maricola TaxID=2601894 RepID=A0A5P9NHS9_9GAMM|nr:tetratricopeptide repeat protein [Halioglobus maricola]QFU75089.1 tetratricopeptide repeat protein [Halioglobus maricola]
MDQYRTEEEQVEALKKWWDENGRSIIVSVIVALGVGFGWQGWQKYTADEAAAASERYQALLQEMAQISDAEGQQTAITMAREIKTEHSRSTYAEFAGLHLARLAAVRGDMAEAEAQLRWVLGRADKGSEVYQLAQLRLARVLASNGDTAQAKSILDGTDAGAHEASYAVARGDIAMLEGNEEEARAAYTQALSLAAQSGGGQVSLSLVQQKLQSLSPVMPRDIEAVAPVAPVAQDPTETTEATEAQE